jgi:hypothetical protein
MQSVVGGYLRIEPLDIDWAECPADEWQQIKADDYST